MISPFSISYPDGSEILIRPLAETDSLADLTELLHRAYRVLADMGLRFFATYQTEEDTRTRLKDAHCLVGVMENTIVATIALYKDVSRQSSPCEWYRQKGVWTFGQFAVEPTLQKKGIGGILIDTIENIARTAGAKELALDTSERATHLISYYSKRGYRHADYVQWEKTNYRSVVMSKFLANPVKE